MANKTAVPPAPQNESADAPPPSGGGASGGTPPAGRTGLAKLKEKLTIPRSTTPYFVASLLAAVAMGWYFFVFVPQKLEYFMGLRFRTLAVASGQIKGKSESLGLSLNSAPAPRTAVSVVAPGNALQPAAHAVPACAGAPPVASGEGDAAADSAPPADEKDSTKYLRLVVPDIQLSERGASPRTSGLQLVVNRPDNDPNESLCATVAWDRVASQGAEASALEFDDLVLADAHGDVVWQREKTTPRLGNLKELLYAEDDKGTLMSPSWAIRTVFPAVDAKKELPKTATLKAVRVGATSTWMLVQAVRLDSPYITDQAQTTLYVAGFVSRSRLQQQAMRIPLAWLVVVSLPIAVLFLAMPFIKLATMNAKERFSVVNLLLMAIGTIAAAGLASVIPVVPRSVSDVGDHTLEEIAELVDTRLGEETSSVLALAQAVARLPESASNPSNPSNPNLENCAVAHTLEPWSTYRLCDLWGALPGFLDNAADKGVPELDVTIWLNDRGEQVRKWTTKAQLTGQASHRAFEHFQNLTSGNLWSLRGNGAIPFTIEPLRAPTTAELGVVFAMPLQPLRDSTPVRTVSTNAAHEARFLALNVRPHAVVDAVMPPGIGFAIVAPNGKVLFHSNAGLSLEENFFEEVSNAQGVRERMQMERPETWSGDYHGTPHRIHIQPVSTLQRCPWKIVTFQDLSPGLASVVDHQSGTFRLGLLNLVLLLAAALAVWWYTKSRGRDIRDLMTAPRSPDPARLRGLVVLMVLAVDAIVATERPSAHQWADFIYVFFVLLPFAALWVSVYARCPAALPEEGSNSALVRFELAILIVLVGAAPAVGFARVVQRVQEVQATERWLETAYQRTSEQANRARVRAIGPAYTDATGAKLVAHPAFRGGAEPEALHFYVSRSPVWEANQAAECTEAPVSGGQVLVRSILNWTMFSSDRRGDTKVKACAGSNRLRVTDKGISLAATAWPWPADNAGADRDKAAGSGTSRRGVDVDGLRWALAILILGGTIAAAYWARRRLITPNAIGASTLENVVTLIASDGNQGIMLVGPPRVRKDELVKRVVTKHAGLAKRLDGQAPIYRIELLDATIDASFLETTLAEVSKRVNEPSMLDGENRLWIQVSNLEAQLITSERRTAVLELLEKLLERPDGEPSRVVVVTTSIDPIAHFHEIFTKEREGIYDDDSPEVQLSRSSLLLSRFRRCYLPINASRSIDPWWKYEPAAWESTLDWEAAEYPPLVEVAKAIKKALSDRAEPRKPVSRAELARMFGSQALASYDLLWASCTRCEKIVLIQLAQEGFVTTQNCEVLWGLINKGLIVERPRPTIFNNSFRLFLRHIERDHVVEQWEQEDGNGLWVVAGRLIGSSLIAGGLFYLTTQDFSVDSLLPVVSGTGVFGAPVVRALLARVTMRGAAPIA